MLNNLCLKLSQNKNLLMLLTVGIYVLALYATFSGTILIFSLLLFITSLLCIFKKYFPYKYLIIWNLLFYIGVLNTTLRLRDIDDLLNLAPINSEITGTIVSIPQGFTEGKPKFFFDVKKIKFGSVEKELKDEKVLVTMNSFNSSKELKIYNTGKLEGRLSIPFKAGNPSQFDYGNYLRNHNTYAVFYANSFTPVNSELSVKANVLQKINDYREKILVIHAKYLPSPNLEILGGIVFGDDAVSPPKDIKQSFVQSGLLHILAASGMNVAFIYTFFFWIFSFLRVNYKISVVLGMLTVIAYALMTGLGASVIRATCMLLFVLIGKLIDRDAHSISLLSFVGLLMLLYNPLFINDVGFQLSFVVTFGLLIMTPVLNKFENNKIKSFIVTTITIPVVAQLWVIPIQIFYFNNISLYSVFANIMSVPILMVLSFGGFVSSLLAGITPIADFVCKTFDFILNPLLSVLVNISDFWGQLPNATMQTTHPSVFQILVYYGILLLLSAFIYKNFREKYLKPILITTLFFVFIWLISIVPIKNSNLEILTFDVGNADCFLIKTPSNEYLMVDTGKYGYKGGKTQAEVIVLKYLRDRGIKELDSLIITHFDNDHCGGAVDILSNLKVKDVYINDLNHNSNSAKYIYKAAENNQSKLVLAQSGQVVYDKNGLRLTNLLGVSTDNDNENSIITLLEYNKFTMLFTGDAGVTGLKEVLNDIPKNITVLKVPHHGANGGLDKGIVGYLNPRYSVISVGENKFGHPAVYTLRLLENSKILRTDINNSILIKANKEGFNIFTYDLRKRKYIKQKKI